MRRESRGSFSLPWIAARHPARYRTSRGSAPRFDGKGDILFRRAGGSRSERTVGTVFRVHRDGSGWKKAFEQPVLMVGAISPDRRWLEAWAPLSGNGPPAIQVVPLDGGKPVIVGTVWALLYLKLGAFAIGALLLMGAFVVANRTRLL